MVIQGIKQLSSGDIKYLTELVEDNVFYEYTAQLIAHNMSEALKEKNVVILGFHVNCSDRFNISCETSYTEFPIDHTNFLFLSNIFQ